MEHWFALQKKRGCEKKKRFRDIWRGMEGNSKFSILFSINVLFFSLSFSFFIIAKKVKNSFYTYYSGNEFIYAFPY